MHLENLGQIYMHKQFKGSLIIFCIFASIYIGTTYKTRVSTDSIINTLLPISIIRGEGFELKYIYPVVSRHMPTIKGASGLPYYIIEKNNHLFSAFPIFSSVLATPVYLIPVVTKNITVSNINENIDTILYLGKISASIFSAISVSFVFLTLKRVTKKSTVALLLTFFYGLGTSTFSISSQSMWQHAASQMLLSITLYLFITAKNRGNQYAMCGFFLGVATLCRFSNIFFATAFLIFILLYEKKQLLQFLKYAILPFLFFVWYQITYPGSLFFYKYEALGEIATFHNSFLVGFFGLLIAPSKGLLIYSPLFIFSIVGSFLAIKQKDRKLIFISIVSVLYLSFIAKWSAWHGGWSFGPRMLADLTPLLTILISPVLSREKLWKLPLIKITFTLLFTISTVIHFFGATISNFSWYMLKTNNLTLNESHQAKFLWDLDNIEIYYFYTLIGSVGKMFEIFVRETSSMLQIFVIYFLPIIILWQIYISITKKTTIEKKSISKQKKREHI